jgi:hypothetical protein
MTFGLKWLKKAFLKIAFIGLIASFAQSAAALDFNLTLPDPIEGPLKITVSLDPNASTVDVKVELQNGCVSNADNVKVNWSQSTLEQFIKDVADPSKWFDNLLNFGEMPVAVKRINDDTTLQVRVGYTNPNPPGALVDVQIELDTSTCGDAPLPQEVSSTLIIGKRVTLVPQNFPNMCVGHFLFGLHNLIHDGTDVVKKNCTFEVMKGLDGRNNTISLRSVNYPTFYVNHFAFAVNISAPNGTQVYKDNASFIQIPGAVGTGTISLVPVNFRTHRVRHFLHRLYIHDKAGIVGFFSADSSFKVTPPVWTGPEGL